MTDIRTVRADALRAETALVKHLEAIRTRRIADDPTETARLRAELVCRKADLNFWERLNQRRSDAEAIEGTAAFAAS